jgi:hypothetical protein
VRAEERESVVRRPEAMGARMLVANMNACIVSFRQEAKWEGGETYGHNTQTSS